MYLVVDTGNGSESVAIGTGVSGTAISIGHSTSETTVNDNLTVAGNLTVNGDSTTVDTTNTTVKDTLLGLNSGASSNSNDVGIIMKEDQQVMMLCLYGMSRKTSLLDEQQQTTQVVQATLT